MKTSLNIDDLLFREAKKESGASGRTLSEIISHWALVGKKVLMENSTKKKKFSPLSLGEQKTDISKRKDWMDELK